MCIEEPLQVLASLFPSNQLEKASTGPKRNLWELL